MSTESKDREQTALAARLDQSWTNFKQGKILSYRLMAILLLLVAGLGLWWYLAAERRKANSARWMEFDEANTPAKLEELSKNNPKTIMPRLADLLIARSQLGAKGIDQLNSPQAEEKMQAVDNIVKARETFGKLLDQFKDDPIYKVECLLGLARAEAALLGERVKSEQAPAGPGPIAPGTEFRGKVEKVIEYLDQLAAAAAPDTPWATDAKKLADELRANPEKFIATTRLLADIPEPRLPKLGGDPHGGFGPIAPSGSPPPLPPGVPGIPGGK